jgi:hypothetical protein
MRRFVLIVSAVMAAWSLSAGSALASQCPKLIKAINDAAGNRFDSAAAEARAKAAEAQALHDAKKHAESEKAAKEGMDKLGLKM